MAQKNHIAIATAVAFALHAGAALAQSRQSGEIEEVVVTAQKAGVQSLQSVPLAVQAFGGEALKEMNISTIQDLVTAGLRRRRLGAHHHG